MPAEATMRVQTYVGGALDGALLHDDAWARLDAVEQTYLAAAPQAVYWDERDATSTVEFTTYVREKFALSHRVELLAFVDNRLTHAEAFGRATIELAKHQAPRLEPRRFDSESPPTTIFGFPVQLVAWDERDRPLVMDAPLKIPDVGSVVEFDLEKFAKATDERRYRGTWGV